MSPRVFKNTSSIATQRVLDINNSRISPKEKKSSEIRYDLVRKFQNELKKGDYSIKANDIAEKIVQKISDDKDKKFL